MRVTKPAKSVLLTRPLVRAKRLDLGVTGAFAFRLDQPRDLVDEISFWPAATAALGASVLDEVYPKPCGEVLVAGSFHAPEGKALRASFARVQVGAIDKSVSVLGDRVWRDGVATEPAPFVEMPLDWAHAFGGKSSDANPYGVGLDPVVRDGRKVVPLPNVERYGGLLRQPSDRPRPESFLPMDLSFPVRRAKAGTFGRDWLEKWAPGLPGDCEPSFFHCAHPDQWLKGYFSGTEPIVLHNLHPKTSRLESKLPGLSMRAFATVRGQDAAQLTEIGLSCDTVWLFPSLGLGAVLFHGALPITQEDGSDVTNLVLACEELGRPRALDHYVAALVRRLDKDKGAIAQLSDKDLMPDVGSGVAPNVGGGDLGLWVKSERILQANILRGRDRNRARAVEAVLAEGLDPAAYGLMDPEPPEELPPEDLDELAAFVERMEQRGLDEEKRAKEAMKQRPDVDDELARSTIEAVDAADVPGGPPAFSARAEAERIRGLVVAARAEGVPVAELEAEVARPDFEARLYEQERQLREAYRMGAHLAPDAAVATSEASILGRGIIEAARTGQEPLRERDFTGLDLAGCDLSGLDLGGSFFEGADLRGANLSGADLSRAVLAKADLRDATLTDATLVGANLGFSRCDGAKLDGANLTDAVLMKARLAGASLRRATLVGADLLDVAFDDVALDGACLDRCNFLRASFVGAKLAGISAASATFVECSVERADFGGANLAKASFITCVGREARFARANMSEAVVLHGSELRGCDFSDATLDKSCLRGSVLRDGRFDRVSGTMLDLSECDLEGASLERAELRQALMIRSKLTNASLRGANLTEALLTKAHVAGADFTGAQLCRADLLGAVGDARTRFTDASVKFARFDRGASRT